MRPRLVFLFIFTLSLGFYSHAQDLSELDLDGDELKILLEEIPMEETDQASAKKTPPKKKNQAIKAQSALDSELVELEKIDGFSNAEQLTKKDDQEYLNDLESFKNDVGDLDFGELVIPEEDTIELKPKRAVRKRTVDKKTSPSKTQGKTKSKISSTPKKTAKKTVQVFDTGLEERSLLEIAKFVKDKVSSEDWGKVLESSNRQTYIVQKDDWLFKIARKLFGSGFYYPKIWSLNDYITNPHEIEPGMVLVFDTGDMDSLPAVKLGKFAGNKVSGEVLPDGFTSFESFGEGARPPWLNEKEKLLEDGTFFQYATESTVGDLKRLSEQSLVTEYKNYDPPGLDLNAELPEVYDETGFDKSSKLEVNYKEGFFLNTFIANNPMKDFGFIDSAINEGSLLARGDTIFINLDDISPKVGDEFSVYRFESEVGGDRLISRLQDAGKEAKAKSERKGRKYTIIAQVKLLAKKSDTLWEARLTDSTSIVERGDRITTYTPKIERIVKRFSPRRIEGLIVDTFNEGQNLPGFGDVVYLDRGRADGVELGDIFEIWGFEDRMTDQKITFDPTYKNGEVTVISLTDNFATVLITNVRRDFGVGDVAITKSKAKALMSDRMKMAQAGGDIGNLDRREDLDVELKLEDLNSDMMKGAERVKFTEDELAELEKLEREKSIIKTSKDELTDLEKLERQLELTERELSEGKRDQDKLLEGENLDDIEQKQRFSFGEDLEIIEENFGKKYLDEELNKNDNPYGLTEFDIEEVDELLNLDKNKNDSEKTEQY